MAFSIVAGLLFGLAVAGLNTVIMRRAIKKGTSSHLLAAVTVRMLLDAAALGAVYLARGRLPLLFQPTLVATAVGLSAGIISLAILTSRVKPNDRSDQTGGE